VYLNNARFEQPCAQGAITRCGVLSARPGIGRPRNSRSDRTEGRDVSLHPDQYSLLIKDGLVYPSMKSAFDRRMRERKKRTCSNGSNEVRRTWERRSSRVARACCHVIVDSPSKISAAVDPQTHARLRDLTSAVVRRQIQAVLGNTLMLVRSREKSELITCGQRLPRAVASSRSRSQLSDSLWRRTSEGHYRWRRAYVIPKKISTRSS